MIEKIKDFYDKNKEKIKKGTLIGSFGILILELINIKNEQMDIFKNQSHILKHEIEMQTKMNYILHNEIELQDQLERLKEHK